MNLMLKYKYRQMYVPRQAERMPHAAHLHAGLALALALDPAGRQRWMPCCAPSRSSCVTGPKRLADAFVPAGGVSVPLRPLI